MNMRADAMVNINMMGNKNEYESWLHAKNLPSLFVHTESNPDRPIRKAIEPIFEKLKSEKTDHYYGDGFGNTWGEILILAHEALTL